MIGDISIPPERFTRDMGLTHADFFRTLPSAAEPYAVKVAGNRAIVEAGTLKLVITLQPESKRQIASLVLPTTQVEFAFLGFSGQQRLEFMQRFDLRYLRGGG